MAPNFRFLPLLGVLLLVPLLSAKLITLNSYTQRGTSLNDSYFAWGVEPGDILSFSLQAWLDDRDLLEQVQYREPLVVKVLIERTPCIPRYFQDQINLSSSFFPQMEILGYFQGNTRASVLDLRTEFPDYSTITFHYYVLATQAAVYPGYLDYLAKLYRSGTVNRTENTGDDLIWETKYEHGIHYFRVTEKGEIPSLGFSYDLMIEFSRQDGIARELQIEVLRAYDPNTLQDISIDPGIHKLEEHIEFLKKENVDYVHEGSSDIEPIFLLATIGSAFGLGTILGIRMRRFRAQKNS